MKRKQRTKLETTYAHAAQIFCEMLGQVCHKEFYDNPYTTFQEVGISLRFRTENRHLSSMRGMRHAIFFTPGFQTSI